MPAHLRIREYSNKGFVHFSKNQNDYTVCGLETSGDKKLGLGVGRPVKTKVDCPDCIRMVELCQSIKSSEFIPSSKLPI